MGAAALLRVAKLKGDGHVRKAAAHNLRAIPAELRARGSIDPTRAHLNVVLAGPTHPSEVAALAVARMVNAGVKKLRKDAVTALEFVVSLPPAQVADEAGLFRAALAWLAQRFGGHDNVLSAVIHHDEAAPHMHVLVLPLLDGRMQGSDALGGPTQLTQLQSAFFNAVAKPYGLRKPGSAERGFNKVDAAKAVLAELKRTSDPGMASALWQQLRAAIEADPSASADMLGLDVAVLTKPKKLRSSTAIFTSKGKGSQRREEDNPRVPARGGQDENPKVPARGGEINAAAAPDVGDVQTIALCMVSKAEVSGVNPSSAPQRGNLLSRMGRVITRRAAGRVTLPIAYEDARWEFAIKLEHEDTKCATQEART